MTVVKKLTQMNLTVCATIHSPTPYCFNQFDRLMLLLRGQTVYFGPNGAPLEPTLQLFLWVMPARVTSAHTTMHSRGAPIAWDTAGRGHLKGDCLHRICPDQLP